MAEHEPLLAGSVRHGDVEGSTDPQERVRHHDVHEHPRGHWRLATPEFLESKASHYIVFSLVVVDSVCVLADLTYIVLSETCAPIEGPDAPMWLDTLSLISRLITVSFLAEIPLTLWAVGFKHYNPLGSTPHAPLHLFDATVIITTFILEVLLKGKERELASLLVILRLWRLVKLVGGVAVGAGEINEQTTRDLFETRSKLNETYQTLAEVRDENHHLRARIAWLEAGAQVPSG